MVAFGVKIRWAPDEVPKLHALARSPARMFEVREEAIERYLKVSGLFGLVDPSSPSPQSGVREENGKFRLAADPMINAAAGPDLAPHRARDDDARCASAPGSKDPMVNAADMQPFDPTARHRRRRRPQRAGGEARRALAEDPEGARMSERPAQALARGYPLA